MESVCGLDAGEGGKVPGFGKNEQHFPPKKGTPERPLSLVLFDYSYSLEYLVSRSYFAFAFSSAFSKRTAARSGFVWARRA